MVDVMELREKLRQFARDLEANEDDSLTADVLREAADALDEAARMRERVEAVRHVIQQGYQTPANKLDQCEHGKFGWEDCISCYDVALLAALDAHPHSGASHD
jgi:hypothetical protein